VTAATQIGEAFVGDGAEAAHINTVLGARGSPVETAWVSALAMPRTGHAAFIVVVRPGLAVKPLTLFVNKAELTGPSHARLTWGAAQAGVASGVLAAVADEVVPATEVEGLLLVTAVWVDPAANDEGSVYENNRVATLQALVCGRDGAPPLDALMKVRDAPGNPFFEPDRFLA
jgi:5,6,7,8-tetrahydromethanopterin hydro-lyase